MVKVVFLCHGNICRSPMAEFIMKDLCETEDVYIESAAVSREEIGNPIYPPAQKILRAKGIPFDNRKARQFTLDDYNNFDIIVIMEQYNMPRLLRIIGEDKQNKVKRLLDFTDTPGDIEDPWYSGNFEKVFEQIRYGCEALLKKIRES